MGMAYGHGGVLPPALSPSFGAAQLRWLRAHRMLAAVVATAVLSAGAASLVTAEALLAHPATASSLTGSPALSAGTGHLTLGIASATPVSATSAVIIGDSHAWLWAMRVPTIPDLGVPGAVTAGIAQQIPEALAMHPKYVVMSAGTNDLNLGHTPADVIASLQAMVAEIKAGGATPILLLLPSFGTSMHTTIWTETQLLPSSVPSTLALGGSAGVAPVNAAIEAMGIPTLQAPAGETIDGIHLNAAGYAVITAQLMKIIG